MVEKPARAGFVIHYLWNLSLLFFSSTASSRCYVVSQVCSTSPSTSCRSQGHGNSVPSHFVIDTFGCCFEGSGQGASSSITSTSSGRGNTTYIFTCTHRSSVPSSVSRTSFCITACCNSLNQRRFHTAQEFVAFSRLCTSSVVAVHRQRDSGQDTDNCYDDHQFDQGETFLDCFHLINSSLKSVVNKNVCCKKSVMCLALLVYE